MTDGKWYEVAGFTSVTGVLGFAHRLSYSSVAENGGNLANSSDDSPDYFAEALGELKEQAEAQDLIVDADATQALRDAFIQVDELQGLDAFSSEHQAEFAKVASLLAEEATKAAISDHAQFVNHLHVEAAIEQLQTWDVWPFKGD